MYNLKIVIKLVSALLAVAIFLIGCATTEPASRPRESKEGKVTLSQLLASSLALTSLSNNQREVEMNHYSATFTEDEKRLVDAIIKHRKETGEWIEHVSVVPLYPSFTDIKFEEEEGRLYCGIDRIDDFKTIFAMDESFSVIHTSLPNDLYEKVILPVLKERKVGEDYSPLNAFWDNLPNALSHL